MILGVDLSIVSTGMAKLVGGKLADFRVIKTTPEWSELRRIQHIVDEIYAWAEDAERVALEDFSLHSPGRVHTTAMLHGVVRMAIWEAWPARLEIWPIKTWRKAVLGNGNAQKEDVKVGMFKRGFDETVPTDALEAAAVALCSWIRWNDPSTWTQYQAEAFAPKKPKTRRRHAT